MLCDGGTGSAIDAPLLEATEQSLRHLSEFLVTRLVASLEAAGRDVTGAQILLVGVGYKVGSSDLTNTPAREIVRLLRRLGATPVYVDGGAPEFAVDGVAVERAEPGQLESGGFAAALILSGDCRLSGSALRRVTGVVFDASGGRALDGLPDDISQI